jgi:hypothetical protein
MTETKQLTTPATELTEEDFSSTLKIEECETILTKEEKKKCYEVATEVSKYLTTDREKLFLIERLVMELENDKLSIVFGKSVRQTRAEMNKKTVVATKKTLVLK